jgi:hypothetical protein
MSTAGMRVVDWNEEQKENVVPFNGYGPYSAQNLAEERKESTRSWRDMSGLLWRHSTSRGIGEEFGGEGNGDGNLNGELDAVEVHGHV